MLLACSRLYSSSSNFKRSNSRASRFSTCKESAQQYARANRRIRDHKDGRRCVRSTTRQRNSNKLARATVTGNQFGAGRALGVGVRKRRACLHRVRNKSVAHLLKSVEVLQVVVDVAFDFKPAVAARFRTQEGLEIHVLRLLVHHLRLGGWRSGGCLSVNECWDANANGCSAKSTRTRRFAIPCENRKPTVVNATYKCPLLAVRLGATRHVAFERLLPGMYPHVSL
jgi:hypothetical protein